MPGRNFSSNSYRYGFGGHEKDDEISGSGNAIDFEGYGYDPRLGRRKGVDPLANKFVGESPYSAFGNNPIFYIDKDGKTKITYVTIINKDGHRQTFKMIDSKYVAKINYGSQLTATGYHNQHIVEYDVNVYITKDYRNVKDGKPQITTSAKLFERTLNDELKPVKEATSAGIKTITPILDDNASGWKNTGTGVALVSAVALQPEGVAAGESMIQVGSVIGDVSVGLKVLDAVLEGNKNKAAAYLISLAVGKVMENSINQQSSGDASKLIQNKIADKANDIVTESEVKKTEQPITK